MGSPDRIVNLSWILPPSACMSFIMSLTIETKINSVDVGRYVVLVRRGENTSWSDAVEVVTGSRETGARVASLHPFTVYSFKVAALTSAGGDTATAAEGDIEAQSAASPESYYMVTLREAPSGSPTITVAHNISSNALYMVGGRGCSQLGSY